MEASGAVAVSAVSEATKESVGTASGTATVIGINPRRPFNAVATGTAAIAATSSFDVAIAPAAVLVCLTEPATDPGSAFQANAFQNRPAFQTAAEAGTVTELTTLHCVEFIPEDEAA